MTAAYVPETSSVNITLLRSTINKLLTFPRVGQTMVEVGELQSNCKRVAHHGEFTC